MHSMFPMHPMHPMHAPPLLLPGCFAPHAPSYLAAHILPCLPAVRCMRARSYLAAHKRRPEGHLADLLPWVAEQALGFEAAAVAGAQPSVPMQVRLCVCF